MSAPHTSSTGGVDLQTLVITALASAAAAYVTSEVWAPGTLASAAITPVIVALVKEGLAKPATVVTRAVPVRGVVRNAPRVGEPGDPVAPFEPADERVAQHGEIPGSSRSFPRRAWRMAVITGLLGFVVAAVIITVPDLVSGKSVFGGDRETTLFSSHKSSSSGTSTTTTTTTPTQTETAPAGQTVTVPPVETTTVPPAATTTVPPTETTPAVPPAETTPAPPATPVPPPSQ